MALDEDADVLVRILGRGQREEPGADARGDVLVDTITDDDDAVERRAEVSPIGRGGVHRDGNDAVVELLRADRGIAARARIAGWRRRGGR